MQEITVRVIVDVTMKVTDEQLAEIERRDDNMDCAWEDVVSAICDAVDQLDESHNLLFSRGAEIESYRKT